MIKSDSSIDEEICGGQRIVPATTFQEKSLNIDDTKSFRKVIGSLYSYLSLAK